MESPRFVQLLSTFILALMFSGPVPAEDSPRISDLTSTDRLYMDQQRETIDDISRRNFGSAFTGSTERDLALLQRILDQNLVRPDQTQQLQAMGMVLGDLLASDLDLHWVIYEDKLGRTRALRYRQSNEYLFPVTMISRRREADNDKSVADIYRKAHDIMQASKPALPFQ